MFPQFIAVSGLGPLYKVEADYLPPPKNQFTVKVNGDSYYKLPKEDIDYNPSNVEALACEYLKLNDKEFMRNSMPWILE